MAALRCFSLFLRNLPE